MSCGGFGDYQEMNDEVKAIAMGLKPELEKRMNATFSNFTPIKFKSQVVAGTNYEIVIKADGMNINVKCFKPLPCNGTEITIKDYSATAVL